MRFRFTVAAGSSPRGRGKPPAVRPGCAAGGLIPAWAGKTSRSCPVAREPWAHPRVGGENAVIDTLIADRAGSSPRGRGKPTGAGPEGRPRWLIPAWAGKTRPLPSRSPPTRAHPRVGGENGLRGGRVLFRPRLIPAWAGKTPGRGNGRCVDGAHPRVGGENPTSCLLIDYEGGLIPAWAGKTTGTQVELGGPAAHPRVGGENAASRSFTRR